jgi:hypothetical protein
MTDHELIANIHRRMDNQDALLREVRDLITSHIASEQNLRPALEELATLWKASRSIAAILAGLTVILGGFWAIVAWARDHIK